jgi:D-alanyl-lipoteichoic acid acyltransferase DltB (MBOAT superfamily)
MRNTLIIFLVSGFWHGANWTFIVWGAYHALLFFPLMLFGLNRKYTDEVAAGKLLPSVKEFFQMLLTFALVVIGWVIFRAETISQACDYLAGMCDGSLTDIGSHKGGLAMVCSLVLLSAEWLQRGKEHALQFPKTGSALNAIFRWSVYLVVVLCLLSFSGEKSEFIYFQF